MVDDYREVDELDLPTEGRFKIQFWQHTKTPKINFHVFCLCNKKRSQELYLCRHELEFG